VNDRFTDQTVQTGALIESPCIGVCTIDRTRDICKGCGRTVPEIAGWTRMTPENRRTVMTELPDRLSVGRVRKGGRRARLQSGSSE
jgi:predicted Fe-S protein YdhL (DUF1289 family)